MAGVRISAETCLAQAAGIDSQPGNDFLEELVKFLHSGDPGFIQTRELLVPDYIGVNDLQSSDDRC